MGSPTLRQKPRSGPGVPRLLLPVCLQMRNFRFGGVALFACLHVLCTAWGTVSPPAAPRPAMGAGGCSGWSPPLRAMQGRGSAQIGTGERAVGFPFGAPSSPHRISQSPFPLQHPHRKERAGSSQKCSAEEKETETRPSTNTEPHAHPSLAPTPVAQRRQPGRDFVLPHREHACRWVRASGLRAMNRFRSPGTCWCGNREANVFADRRAAGAASGRKPRRGRRGRDAVTHRDGRGWTDAETECSQEAPGGARFAGLINQGLTCYLNALLQCLFLTPEFRDRIQEKPWTSEPEQALGQIFRGLQRRCGPVPTSALTTCLGLHSSVQQDVAEVFLLLLQHLGRDELQEVFQSEVEKIIQCLVCGHEEHIPSGGRMLILPLASHTQLCGLEGAGQKPGKPANPSSGVSQDTEVLSFSLIQKFDDEDNRFFCEPCNAKTPASEETRFLRLPKVLILQVRELTFENGRFHKIQKPINIAQVLKLHTSPRELTLPKCKASHSGTLTPNPVGPEFPLHHTFRSETPYLLLYRCQDTEDRQEPEAPGPDNGDMRTMTDVAVPKEKVPCPGVEGETLNTDSATVCWGGHSQSLSPLQDDKPICHRQSPAKKYRRDMEPGLGDRGRASEHVDEEGPKAPLPGEQGEARGLPCGPQCSPEEELPAMGMRSSVAEDQALSHPVQGPAQPGKTPSCFGEAAATYVSSPSLTSLPGPHHWLTPSPSHFPRSVSSTHYPASLDVAFGDPCNPQGGRLPILKLSRASPRPDSHPGSSSPAELEAEQGVLGGEAGQSRVGSPGLSSHALSAVHMRMEPTFSKQLQTDSGHEDRKISADQENSQDEGWTMRRDRSASEGSELQGTGWP
uniref:USP domain-containing protein n=1 Tax=Papio anubis TaxID=9555 RepID=A0A8I5NG33_PAPAN